MMGRINRRDQIFGLSRRRACRTTEDNVVRTRFRVGPDETYHDPDCAIFEARECTCWDRPREVKADPELGDGSFAWRIFTGRRWTVDLEWKPQDLWVGLFWKRTSEWGCSGFDAWVCVLPMVPIHIASRRPW